jgi:hypothetical protein
MPEETIEKQRTYLSDEIEDKLEEYRFLWLYNNRRRNWLFFANIACSLGAAISGIFHQAEIAAVFGAILTAILATQKHYSFDQEATWYEIAASRCEILLNKTNSPLATIESLSAIENDLNTLMAGKGEKNKAFKREDTGL